MKSTEELKQEQYDLKAKLHEVIELINNEEFYLLSTMERTLITQQRTGMELYLSSLTKRIYGSNDTNNPDPVWMALMFGMLSTPCNMPSSSLTEKDFESKGDDEQVYAMPV